MPQFTHPAIFDLSALLHLTIVKYGVPGIAFLTVLDWPEQAGREYGKIRTRLKQKGKAIGANDLLIAAHAVTLDVVLVSDNTKEFLRVPGLKLENWINR